MKSLIITEGKLDQILIESILKADPRLRGRYTIVTGGGESAAASLARSYLVTSDTRVVLIADADTSDPDEVPKKHAILSEALGAVAAADRYLVLLAVPEIEIVLFADRKMAEALFGQRLNTADWAEARKNPKLMLGKLIQGSPTGVINLSKLETILQRHDLKPFLQLPLIKALETFVLRNAA